MTFKEELDMAIEHEKEIIKYKEEKQKQFDSLPIDSKLSDACLKASITKAILKIK